MKRKLCWLGSGASLLGFVAYWTRLAPACGPFFSYPVFTNTRQPDSPLGPYTRGKLGVPELQYYRIYLYIAYRNLAGPGFSVADTRALWGDVPGVFEEPAPSTSANMAPSPKDWPREWIDQRNKIPNAGHRDYLQAWGTAEGIYHEGNGPDGNLKYYLNCPPQAFEFAVAALEDRKRRLGDASPDLVSWVQAQDQVFSNCAKGETIPSPLPAGAPKQAIADRQYQIAAAYFYAGKFDKAAASFQETASNPDSPWAAMAKYLVARAYIREATVGYNDNSPDPAALARAESQLRAVLADPKLREFHTSATGLLDYVRVRLHPEERVRELSRTLMQSPVPPSLARNAHDYTFLLDKFEGESFLISPAEFLANRQEAYAKLADLRSHDDLTDWILTFQLNDPSAFDHAYSRWHETRSPAWLVAAIAKAQAGDPRAPALLAAARAVGPSAPAYAAVMFHRLRLMAQSGQRDAVVAELDELLTRDAQRFPRSALNLFLALRMRFARDLKEFLKFAPRVPLELAYNGYPPPESRPSHPPPGSPWFDMDAVIALNQFMPVSLLTEIVADSALPDHLRRQIAIGAWTRAFLLNDGTAAVTLARPLGQFAPEMRADLNAFVNAPTPAERRFAGVFLILRFPGLRPYVTSPERATPLDRIDNLRENWWGPGSPCGMLWEDYAWDTNNWPENPAQRPKWPSLNWPLRQIYASGKPIRPSFLNEQDLQSAEREWERTQALAAAPDYLGPAAIDWVRKHPSDPRAAEALAQVVRTTRYGCTSKETSRISQEAFELLHGRYPSTSWAKQTKYWYR